jgi:hypothetical protein
MNCGLPRSGQEAVVAVYAMEDIPRTDLNGLKKLKSLQNVLT